MTKKRKWEYRVQTGFDLPPGATSPIMNSGQMEYALNHLDENGWELVTWGQTPWHDRMTQTWWIFRRPYQTRRERT